MNDFSFWEKIAFVVFMVCIICLLTVLLFNGLRQESEPVPVVAPTPIPTTYFMSEKNVTYNLSDVTFAHAGGAGGARYSSGGISP
jgi:hypothetical protein